MRTETLNLLCNPYKGEPLIRQGDQLVGAVSRQTFDIRNGIPVILLPEALAGRNRQSQRIYDLTAWAYDPIVALGDRIGLNTELRVRQDYIARMQINRGDRVLETAAGTGSNLPHLPQEADYYGLDLSFPMLKRASIKARQADCPAEWVQAEAAYVPFRDETFDLVFQMGGLQFISDPFKAISEMARVAKPGAEVHIIDELRGGSHTLKRMPAHQKYAGSDQVVAGMQRLIPHSMTEIRSQTIPGTDFYALSFRKPGQPARLEKKP